MAFISILEELPPDGVPVLCNCNIYPGLEIECIFDSSNQILTTVTSGLLINAFNVIEWELI
jgi:hypothetical protein